jgi:hypothetical protein
MFWPQAGILSPIPATLERFAGMLYTPQICSTLRNFLMNQEDGASSLTIWQLKAPK